MDEMRRAGKKVTLHLRFIKGNGVPGTENDSGIIEQQICSMMVPILQEVIAEDGQFARTVREGYSQGWIYLIYFDPEFAEVVRRCKAEYDKLARKYDVQMSEEHTKGKSDLLI